MTSTRRLPRVLLVLLAAVGLVAMHQLGSLGHADASPASSGHAHMAGMVMPASGGTVAMSTELDCHAMSHVCAALVAAPFALPAPTAGAVSTVLAAAAGVVRWVHARSGADPPDLTLLSVSRT